MKREKSKQFLITLPCVKNRFSIFLPKVIYFPLLGKFYLGKYHARKETLSSAQVVIEFKDRDCSHVQAWSRSQNGNSLRRMVFWSMPLAFKVPKLWQKLKDANSGFPYVNRKIDCWTMPISKGSSSKLFDAMDGCTMILCGSSSIRTT